MNRTSGTTWGPDVTGPIDRAVEMAAQWPRETIQDGSREHHLEYRENTLVDNNGTGSNGWRSPARPKPGTGSRRTA